MARLSSFLKVSALACSLAAISAASAADLLPPPPDLDRDEVVELGNGWYLRGDVGYIDYATPRDVAFGVPGALPLDGERLEAAVSVGGGIGYQLANWLRVDATVDHRFGAELSGTRPNPTYAVGAIRDVAEIESTTGLLNAYVDLGSWAGVTPYLGAGIGVAGNRLMDARREAYLLGEPVGAAVIDTRTTYNLAWALMAGLAVDLGSGFKVDLGYRYTHLGDVRTRIDGPGAGLKVEDLNAHEVRLGARYMIE